jgi:hypothetical protein
MKKIQMELATKEIYTIIECLQRLKSSKFLLKISKSNLTVEEIDQLIGKFGKYSVQWQIEKVKEA